MLLDSIARNYPIGSLLLLAETDMTAPLLKSRPVKATYATSDDADSPDAGEMQPNTYYILDGQQRLASIVRVLLQGSAEEAYYFDLQKLKGFDGSQTGADWIVSKKISSKVTSRFLRSNVVVDRVRCQELVDEYFENDDPELRDQRNVQRRVSAKINAVFETIRNYEVPYVMIDRTESLEAICRIFETINSTGTRLTTFDLAVARFFPEPDLQSLWEASRERHSTLVKYDVDGERVLQVIALLVAVSQKSVGEVTRSTLLNLSKSDVAEKWDAAVKYLVSAYTWAEEHGVTPRMFPNEALMVPLAVFFSQATTKWINTVPGYQSILQKWYFASCLQQGAKQASNYRVIEATTELLRWVNDGNVPSPPKVFLTTEKIMLLSSKDSRYRGIMSFLRWHAKVDLWTGKQLDAHKVQDHHIFPAAAAVRNLVPKKHLDSIGNRLLILESSNRHIGDRMPQDYILKRYDDAAKSSTIDSMYADFGRACIVLPHGRNSVRNMFDVANAQSFIRDRTDSILNLLRSILGDALIVEEEDHQDN